MGFIIIKYVGDKIFFIVCDFIFCRYVGIKVDAFYVHIMFSQMNILCNLMRLCEENLLQLL